MKKLLLLSAFLIFACSSDDSTSDDNNQSFLEKYNGVVWKDDGFDDGFGDYIYFYYSFTLNSISQAEKYGADCEPGSTNWDVEDSEGLYLRVVENLPEKLVFEELELPDNGIPELVTYTVTTINNGNGVEIRFSFDNSIDTYTRVSDFCE